MVFFLDFETTGLNVLKHHIVEIGVLSQYNAVFQTVVCPPVFSAEPGVHGIHDDELREGPTFAEAFARMVVFLDNSTCMAVSDDGESSDDENRCCQPRLKDRPPSVVLAAHNGFRFDIPIMLSE